MILERFMQMTYLTKLREVVVQATKKSRSQSKGWDNRKVKIRNRHLPRGKFYRRFERESFQRECDELLNVMEDLISHLELKQL